VTDPSVVIQPTGCTILHQSRCPYGEGSTSGTKPPTFATPSLPIPRWFSCRDTAGKSARFRAGSCTTRIRPITGRPSLFPTPLPAPPSVDLTASLPSFQKERYRLPTFRKVDKDGLGALCSPVALGVHDRVMARPCTRYGAVLAQASQHLWLVSSYDVYREFTCVHHIIHPAPSPLDAGRDTVPSRFGCQSVTVGTVFAGSVRVVTFSG
jgi:hypothetical protein